MRRTVGTVILALTSALAAGLVLAASDGPPPWAYGFPSAGGAAPAPASPAPAAPAAAPAPDVIPRQLPGSGGSFTLAQIRDGFGPADWFPGAARARACGPT